MQLIRMTATFAGLQNATLTLSPGLTVIEAPNEAGKSTWCAFLRAMLYGIPTRERDRQDYIAEKNRYQPWSGLAMEGMVELLWRGEAITLRRWSKGGIPFGGFSATYTQTAQPFPGLTGENCGETLLGVSREVYERTAFVGQGSIPIGESPELEQRITALVSSGEEEVSFSKVDQRLREWLNRRKFNKSGLIPKLENELSVLEDALAHQAQAKERAEEARRELDRLLPRQKALSAALASWRSQETRERLRLYEAAQTELQQAQAEVDALQALLNRHGPTPDKDTLRAAQADLARLKAMEADLKTAQAQLSQAQTQAETAQAQAADPLFSGVEPQEALQAAQADAQEADRPSRAPLALLLCALLALFSGVGAYLLSPPALALPLALSLAVLGGVLLLLSFLLRRKDRVRRETLLRRYGVSSPQELLPRAQDFARRAQAREEAERRLEEAQETLAALEEKRDGLRASLLELVRGFESSVTDSFGLSAALSRALSLRDRLEGAKIRLEGAEKLAARLPKPQAPLSQEEGGPLDADFDPAAAQEELSELEGRLSQLKALLASAEGELRTLGDPLLFETRRQELTEALTRRREEYAALQLARTCLAQADREMQKRFSPALSAQAGRYLSALTGGKYDRLTLSRSFEAAAGEPPRRALLLSQGTAEQLYLAVRLAVCRLALPADETAPLVLDDALASFDDTRMALALRCLLDLSRERQILLFTCHGREARALSGEAGVSFLSLQS